MFGDRDGLETEFGAFDKCFVLMNFAPGLKIAGPAFRAQP